MAMCIIVFLLIYIYTEFVELKVGRYIYIFPPPSLSRYNNAETFDNYITARLEEEEKKVAAAAACSIYPPVF
jgi:hypothetical protein